MPGNRYGDYAVLAVAATASVAAALALGSRQECPQPSARSVESLFAPCVAEASRPVNVAALPSPEQFLAGARRDPWMQWARPRAAPDPADVTGSTSRP